MDELIDILDDSGSFTGKTELKSHAHRMGLFHATVHIWFYTEDGKVLLQLRGKNKSIYPLLWDVSVAGHIGSAEEIESSALREIEEEIGIRVSTQDLLKIGVFKSVQKHPNNLVDAEFHHTFLCKLTVPLDQLKKQESEVEDLKLITIANFDKEINEASIPVCYVPHKLSYYNSILLKIKEVLKNRS